MLVGFGANVEGLAVEGELACGFGCVVFKLQGEGEGCGDCDAFEGEGSGGGVACIGLKDWGAEGGCWEGCCVEIFRCEGLGRDGAEGEGGDIDFDVDLAFCFSGGFWIKRDIGRPVGKAS